MALHRQLGQDVVLAVRLHCLVSSRHHCEHLGPSRKTTTPIQPNIAGSRRYAWVQMQILWENVFMFEGVMPQLQSKTIYPDEPKKP